MNNRTEGGLIGINKKLTIITMTVLLISSVLAPLMVYESEGSGGFSYYGLDYQFDGKGGVFVEGITSGQETGKELSIPYSVQNGTDIYRVSEIGSEAFEGADIEKVSIYADNMEISDHAFSDCSSLKDIAFKFISRQTSECRMIIEEYAFEGCSSLTKIDLPVSTVFIGKSAFANCTSMETAKIQGNVEEIGDNAFNGCTSLNSITICKSDKYCSIDGVLFDKDAKTLIQYPIGSQNKTYVIPSGIEKIGDNAFAYPKSSTSNATRMFIIIPNTVTEIGASAFKNCPIGEITVPSSVSVIGNSAFAGCGLCHTDGTAITDNNDLIGHSFSRDIKGNCIEQENTSNVFFNENGGDTHINSKYIPDETTFMFLPELVWVGHHFKHWVDNLGNTYDGGKTATITQEMMSEAMAKDGYLIFTAEWDSDCTVSLDANGGTVNPDTMVCVIDTLYGELPTPTKDGFTFVGWYLGDELITSNSICKGDCTLSAHWEVVICTITFDVNYEGGEPITKQITYGSQIGKLPDEPTRDGYKFVGWFDAKEGGKQIDEQYVCTDNIIVYAHWEQASSSDNGSTFGLIILIIAMIGIIVGISMYHYREPKPPKY